MTAYIRIGIHTSLKSPTVNQTLPYILHFFEMMYTLRISKDYEGWILYFLVTPSTLIPGTAFQFKHSQ